MARNQNGIITTPWANTGDVQDPPAAGLQLTEGWPVQYSQAGGPAPQRTVFNWLFRLLSTFGGDVQSMGILEWDTSIAYVQHARVMGSDGAIYRAVQANTGNDPVTDTGTNWTEDVQEASQVQALAGTAGNVYMSPRRVLNALQQLGLWLDVNDQPQRLANLHPSDGDITAGNYYFDNLTGGQPAGVVGYGTALVRRGHLDSGDSWATLEIDYYQVTSGSAAKYTSDWNPTTSSWSAWIKNTDGTSGWGLPSLTEDSGIRDLNTLTETGTFHIRVDRGATNVPSTSNGDLIISSIFESPFGTANNGTQIYIDWAGRMYVRGQNGGTWGDWTGPLTDGTVSQVGTRDTTGNWTLSGLTANKPVKFYLNMTGTGESELRFGSVTGALSGTLQNPDNASGWGVRFTADTGRRGMPSFEITPSGTSLTLPVTTLTRITIVAVQ